MRSFSMLFLLLTISFNAEAGRWFGSSSATLTPSLRDFSEAKVEEAKSLAKGVQDDLEEQTSKAKQKAKKAAKKARIDAERTMKIAAIEAKTSAKKLQADAEEQAAKLHHQSKKALLDAERLLQRQAGSRNLMDGWFSAEKRLQRQAGSRNLMADFSEATRQSKTAAKKALAEAEREFHVKVADTKASAKSLQAESVEQAAKAKMQSQKALRNAREDSMNYLERKTREIKGLFRRD